MYPTMMHAIIFFYLKYLPVTPAYIFYILYLLPAIWMVYCTFWRLNSHKQHTPWFIFKQYFLARPRV